MNKATKRIRLERTVRATVDEVWELWSTKAGIESFWGPEGFMVEVRSLDLRPGGELHYAMIAVGAPQIAFMQNAGRPLSSEHRLTYSEVAAPGRLSFRELVDFISDVEPYGTETTIELSPVGTDRTRVVVTSDAMHDERWTKMATMGREMELDKLEKLLAARRVG